MTPTSKTVDEKVNALIAEKISHGGKLMAMEIMLAHLIARDSISSKTPLQDIHRELVDTATSASGKDQPISDFSLKFETAATSEIDRIFNLASIIHKEFGNND